MKLTPVSQDKIKNGATAKYFGVTLTIARNTNDEFKSKFAELTRPYRTQMDRGSLDEKTMKDITCSALAGTVLVGWDEKEFAVATGNDFPFSESNARYLLLEDSDLRDFVIAYASNLSNYLEEEKAEVQGK